MAEIGALLTSSSALVVYITAVAGVIGTVISVIRCLSLSLYSWFWELDCHLRDKNREISIEFGTNIGEGITGGFTNS